MHVGSRSIAENRIAMTPALIGHISSGRRQQTTKKYLQIVLGIRIEQDRCSEEA